VNRALKRISVSGLAASLLGVSLGAASLAQPAAVGD